MNDFLFELAQQRRKFLEGLDANEGDINLDIFEDFYPDQAHFVFELLQNAEDAEASEVSFTLTDEGCAFEHNGKRMFSESDVRAITGIHNSTKKQSSDQIGKFGVGFKSVFVYTLAPEITSAAFSFRISRLVMPESISRANVGTSTTRFWLPFNNPKKAKVKALEEVSAGLRDLAETTLLFLSNIHSITWQVNDKERGAILRIEHTEEHIEVLKEADGTTTASSHFLRFAQSIEELGKHRVAIAFALELLPNVDRYREDTPLAKQLKIIAVPGQVAVFFPAKKETSGLRFHLHAPFVPELSRASIKNTPVNNPLFQQLASLSAAALHRVRDLGLLNTDFLAVLPNRQDQLGNTEDKDQSPYVAIRDAIIAEFNDEPLMPTYAKGHAPAKHLFQSKASLKELLSSEDIQFLIDDVDEAPQWAANRALQGTDVERFMTGLAIREWDVTEFLELVAERAEENWNGPDDAFMGWLENKPVQWLQQFYALFAHEPETEDELHQLRSARVIKLIDGTFSAGPNCYFPDEHRRYTTIVPCVDPSVYELGKSKLQQKNARKFLEEVGVCEIGERELVEALLESEYSREDRPLKEKDYVAHIRRFIKLLEDEPSALHIFRDYKIFLGCDGKWHTASEIYLDSPYLDTGLSSYYQIVGHPDNLTSLANLYQALPIDTPKVTRFVEALGARKVLEISTVSCRRNPRWDYLRMVRGERCTSPSDVDYAINQFDKLAAAKCIGIARLIWNTMRMREESGRSILQAQFRINYSGGTRYAESQLVHQLRDAEWVPQLETFVKPSAARAELLPNGFVFDPGWEWIEKVEFGKEIELQSAQAQAEAASAMERGRRRKAAAAELGFGNPDDLDWLEKLADIPIERREELLAEWERMRAAIELPDNEPRNPERRAERIGVLAGAAPERKTEERTRSVSVGREEVKEEAAHYLRQQYTADGELICQICKRPMPFRLDDGSPYFERVEFLPEMKKRYHQNYLALCPNHAAMFKHANGSAELMLDLFMEITGNELEVVIAQQDHTIYFTKTHIADLKKVIEIDRSQIEDELSI